MNLWGHDLWQQFKTQINTLSISETKHNIKNASKRNITKYYQEQLQIAQGIQKIGAIIGALSMVPTILPLKWLTDKPVEVEQWLSISEKLQALKKLVHKQLDPQHIKKN